jgi:hypothetical protein
MSNGSLVWLAGYGSNLSRERFLGYIQGGRAPGVDGVCEGCRDHSLPRGDRPVTIPYPLYFAWQSQVWRGGVAFLGHAQDRRHVTLGRMYLITTEQLEDILAQENGADTLASGRETRLAHQPIPSLESKYGCLLELGRIDEVPVLTYTSHEDIAAHPLNPPAAAYVRCMADGLRECYGMSDAAIIDYLSPKPGIAGRLDAPTLQEWIQLF